jgi:hypothetical protein
MRSVEPSRSGRLGFAMARIFQDVSQKARYDLPASLNREIGRIVVRWAYFEHHIQKMIWAVAFDADPKGAALGRIAIQEPRAADRLDLLERVAAVRKLSFDRALLRKMRAPTKTLAEQRDLFAHGLWTKDPNAGWVVQQTRGTWTQYRGGPRGIKRAIPEAIPRDTDDLRATIREIEALIADGKKLLLSFKDEPRSSS